MSVRKARKRRFKALAHDPQKRREFTDGRMKNLTLRPL
jgi:hypothetical protein